MTDDDPTDLPGPGATTAKGATERLELAKREAAAARRAAEAKATIPHFYLGRRVEVDGALTPLGSLAELIVALGAALAEHPGINASYRDGGVERYSRVNVGFTVQTPEGALVPTLIDVDKLTADQIAAQIEAWVAPGAAEQLAAPSLSGGTFTLSALDEGADAFAPIVGPGQVGHLGIGRLRLAALADEDGLRSATVRDLILSCDQRAVRPPAAAAFLDTLVGAVTRTRGDS